LNTGGGSADPLSPAVPPPPPQAPSVAVIPNNAQNLAFRIIRVVVAVVFIALKFRISAAA
jgi:hypothetical protein